MRMMRILCMSILLNDSIIEYVRSYSFSRLEIFKFTGLGHWTELLLSFIKQGSDSGLTLDEAVW
jgi:hypothetical protein